MGELGGEMFLKIHNEFKSVLPGLDKDEYQSLENNILEDRRVHDPILFWIDASGDRWIVDGMHRFEIAEKHGIPYDTKELSFKSASEVIDWIIKHQIGRRNLNPTKLRFYRGTVYKAIKESMSSVTAEEFAKSAGVTVKTLAKDADFVSAIIKLPDDVQEKVLKRSIKVDAPDVKSLAEMPAEVVRGIVSSVESGQATIGQRIAQEHVKATKCASSAEHSFISDGMGGRFCEHCGQDFPSDKPRRDKPDEHGQVCEMVTTIDTMRVQIDKIRHKFYQGNPRWQIALDSLDTARVALKVLSGLDWNNF